MINSLGHCAFRSYIHTSKMSCAHTKIPHWTALNPFILDLLTPPQIRSAIITLQQITLQFPAVKLRRKMELEQLFKNQKCLQILLAP